MKCKRCGQTTLGVVRHSLSLAIDDDEYLDDGVIVGSVNVYLCPKCANDMADLLLDFVKAQCPSGDIRGKQIVSY